MAKRSKITVGNLRAGEARLLEQRKDIITTVTVLARLLRGQFSPALCLEKLQSPSFKKKWHQREDDQRLIVDIQYGCSLHLYQNRNARFVLYVRGMMAYDSFAKNANSPDSICNSVVSDLHMMMQDVINETVELFPHLEEMAIHHLVAAKEAGEEVEL